VTKPKERRLRVGLISLGCAKNLVDAEIMLGALLKDGVEITNDAAQADVVIVNTCSFIDSAQEESVDTILESAELREAKQRGQGLIVSGCLPQRFREELPKLLPEVDVFMGIDQVAQVGELVREAKKRREERLEKHRTSNTERRTSRQNTSESSKVKGQSSREAQSSKNKKRITARLAEFEQALPNTEHVSRVTHHVSRITEPTPHSPLVDVTQRPIYIPDYATPRFRLTPRHFAYLKIAEGCNHPCSFCIIPRMRGSHRSRTQADVVAEAKALLADGVKEINLISQDSTYYGLDLRAAQSSTGVSPARLESHGALAAQKRTGETPVLQRPSRAISSPEKFSAAVKSLPVESTTICSLLRELNALPGDFWIRLLYTHPAHWTDELIQTIAECPKVARYVDIPLQHIHENMLERMRRETSQQYIVDLLKRGHSGHRAAHNVHRRVSGRNGGVFSDAAGFHSRDEVRTARSVCLFARRRDARR
jgi:ribosomal protein S12 methylthiotransferase